MNEGGKKGMKIEQEILENTPASSGKKKIDLGYDSQGIKKR